MLADIDLGTISIDIAYRTDRTNQPFVTDLTTLPRHQKRLSTSNDRRAGGPS